MIPSSAYLLLLLLMAATYATVGLLAVWAGLARVHWFVRLLPLGVALVLLFAIPAHDLAIVVLTAAVVVVAPLWAWRAYAPEVSSDDDRAAPRAGRPFLSFSLTDVLLATAVAAAASAAYTRFPSGIWVVAPRIAIVGAAFGLTTLAAAWVVVSRLRWSVRTVGFALVILGSASCLTFSRTFLDGLVPQTTLANSWTALLVSSSVPVVAWLLFGRLAGWRFACPVAIRHCPPVVSGAHTFRKRVAALAASAIAALAIAPPLVAGTRLALPAPMPKQSPLPRPNGYDQILLASVSLGPTRTPGFGMIGFDTRMDREILEQFEPNLIAARAGMGRGSRVQLDYEDRRSRINATNSFRQLATVFRMEAGIALIEGKLDKATDCFVDAIHLGHIASAGGVARDVAVGAFIKNQYGIRPLARVRHQLSAEQSRMLIEKLQLLDGPVEPLEWLLQRDTAWFDRATPWQRRVMRTLEEWTGRPATAQVVDEVRKRDAARLRLLICELAIRLYWLERQQLPAELSELTPTYLPAIPFDPFLDRPPIYRRVTAEHYYLYSVGPDGNDNSGPGAVAQPGNDDMRLDFDPPSRLASIDWDE